MAAKSFTGITVCCGVLIVIQTVLSSTIRRTSDIDEFMIRDQKTRRRQNYFEESALEKDLFESLDDIVPLKQFEPDEDPEEQPSLTVDYANMIRNDIILLDNSVETRTRKRGNIKVEKNQALPEFECNCQVEDKSQDLGDNAFPRVIHNKTCSGQRCHPAHKCIPSIYYVLVLKRKERKSETQDPRLAREVPDELKHRYVVEEYPIITACICTRDYNF